MKSLLMLLTFCLSCSAMKPKSKIKLSYNKIMEVHIHEKYNYDTLSIFNNDCVLLNNEVLKTKGILPSTGIFFLVYQLPKKQFAFEVHRYQYVDTIFCKGNLDLNFVVNGKRQNVEIRNAIAPFVGIGRQDDSLTILLSDKRFRYD